VKRVITNLGVFDVTERGFVVVELAPGVTLEQARAQSEAEIHTQG
jgi:acyl CoA:acetate/3-ketoacid CoA transferase beta subunit